MWKGGLVWGVWGATAEEGQKYRYSYKKGESKNKLYAAGLELRSWCEVIIFDMHV